MKSLLFILLTLASATSWGQSTISPDYIETFNAAKNLVRNPYAAETTRFSSTSSATLARDVDSGDRLFEKASWNCDTSATNGYCRHEIRTPVAPYATGNCEVSVRFKGDASLYSLVLRTASASVSTTPLFNSTDWTTVSANYPCSSSIASVQIEQTTAGTSPAVNYGLYYGPATNIGTVTQAQYIGSIKVTGCAAAWSTTSTSYGNFATQTGCTYAVTGSLLAPGANRPAFQLASVRPGTYLINAEGRFQNITAGFDNFFRFFDGTNAALEESYPSGSSSGTAGSLSAASINQHITYTAPASNVTFDLQARVGSGGTASIGGTTANPLVIKVFYFPSAGQQAVTSINANYDWTAYTPSFQGLGTPTAVECFHKRDAADLLINCKFQTGTTTGAEARVNLPSGLLVGATSKRPALQTVGRWKRNNTGVADGYTVLASTGNNYVTVALQSGGGYTNLLGSAFGSSELQELINLRIPIQGWEENGKAPILGGGITTSASSSQLINSAQIASTGAACTISPCSISNSDGSWLSTVTRTSTGVYVANFTAGIFSRAPQCWTSWLSNSSTGFIFVSPTSATTANIRAFDAAFSVTDPAGFILFCKAPLN